MPEHLVEIQAAGWQIVRERAFASQGVGARALWRWARSVPGFFLRHRHRVCASSHVTEFISVQPVPACAQWRAGGSQRVHCAHVLPRCTGAGATGARGQPRVGSLQ